jgi:hypothetical protein
VGVGLIVWASYAATRGADARQVSRRAALGLAGAVATACLLGSLWQAGLLALAGVVSQVSPGMLVSFTMPADSQGALAILPVYQLGLTAGFFLVLTGGRRFGQAAAAAGLLAASQIVFLAAAGRLTMGLGELPHALAIRAWGVGVPIALAFLFRTDPHMPVSATWHRRFSPAAGKPLR